MNRFPCTYLNGEVELTEERERHITERHPDLLPEHRKQLIETVAATRPSSNKQAIWECQTVLPMVY